VREHDDIPRRRRRCFNGDSTYARTGRLTEHERARLAELCEHADADPVVPGGGDRYSTWDTGDRGPRPTRSGW
jgi:RIO kinase 1